jgi:arylsulfatase A-like enzyme
MHGYGYRTYCVGKWHLSPWHAGTITSSRGTWPLARGFDRYYGFLGSQTSSWCPDLVYDNQHIDPPYPPEDGYHLNGDLADMAIEFIRDGSRTAPGNRGCAISRSARAASRSWRRRGGPTPAAAGSTWATTATARSCWPA